MLNCWLDRRYGCLFPVTFLKMGAMHHLLAFQIVSGCQNCVKTDENRKSCTPGALKNTRYTYFYNTKIFLNTIFKFEIEEKQNFGFLQIFRIVKGFKKQLFIL